MSDLAKKTLPPGSWPGAKGGAKTAESQQSKQSQSNNDAAAPRSAATPSNLPTKEAASTQGGADDAGSEDNAPSHYTHQKENLENISEEGSAIKMQDSEKLQQPDDDRLEEVEPEPVEEKHTEMNGFHTEDGQSQAETAETAGQEQQEEQSEEGTSSKKTDLTEEAKQAFDQASENQPTSEARESFLQTARSGALPDRSVKPETVAEVSQKMDGEEGEELGTAPTEAQDKATDEEPTATIAEGQQPEATEAGENAPTVTGKTETGAEEGVTATGAEEEAAPTQTEGQTEGAPTETMDSKAAEGIDVQDTVPEGAEQTVTQTQPEGTQMQQEQGTVGESATVPENLDFSLLKGGKVNKGGNVVDSDGRVVGRVVEGILSYLIGKKVDENGDIWSDNGKVIGRAEPITDTERDEMTKEPSPFESFPDAVVDGNGMVVSNGEYVGKVVEGDIKQLRGKSVDPDGDILDRGGNVIGKAERWEPEPEEEPEPEPEADRSILAGKRVNKAGNVVDGNGVIFGRVVEGDVKRMVGRMCDKQGNILSESGDVLGRAEVVPEGEREGMKEGPFAELQGCTVAKDGTVVTPSGDVVGRLVSGDPKVLFGRAVDEDGDVLDRNGNTIGKAERWEPEQVEKKKGALAGRRVNREGNVVDEDGNIIAKLTSGDPNICAGKEIDDDGDVVDSKGTVVGHCTLLQDIPKEEISPEEKEKAAQAEQDRKLAIQMSVCIEQCLDKIRPICKMITEKIDKAERTPEDERDEEALVREVRPLIEEGGRILTEAKGIIKGLDPDGRISANAKHKTAAREATPEEYHLADVLKDLTGDVTTCIENAKKKLEDMPHAKKELNPLWGLLNEPLFQILAAVGLLLSGVLNLVGRLLSGLGLGGLIDGLLGTLGLNRVLEGLGLGGLTGGDKKKKGGGGGLLGGLLGGGK
ncbi:hypothetical protein QBC47DRAFT_398071 [Echria macrotheca]|uniref:DUF6987 domain-containing protein n=1 Tax=Echria macrotheca TaxID=438768 RepID=A0AAJ0BJA9_9PEZI|nr:hypothetical protein QBC47DRAFT_398071 [Echria macrotheca]